MLASFFFVDTPARVVQSGTAGKEPSAEEERGFRWHGVMIGAMIVLAFIGLDLAWVVLALFWLSRYRAMADRNDVRYRTPRSLWRE